MAGAAVRFPVRNNVVDLSLGTRLLIMEENEVLDQLRDQSFQKRSEILEQLRNDLRRNQGRLSYDDPRPVFQGLALALCDSNWDVRHQTIQLLHELIPSLGEDVDIYMAIVLPQLVPNIGDAKITIRRAAVQTIHVYMKFTTNVKNVFNALVEYGVNSTDHKVRKETIVSLPMLLTPEFAQEDFTVIVQSLARKLVDSSGRSSVMEEHLHQQVFSALEKVRTFVGDNTFDFYLQQLPRTASKYYTKLMNQDSLDSRSASSSVATPRRFTMSVNADGHSSSPKQAPSTPIHHYDSKLDFGVIPSHIMDQLNDQSDFRTRASAVEELKTIISDLDDTNLLVPHMMSFISFLNNLLDDGNFKITTVTLEILALLVNKLNLTVKPYLKPIVAALSKRMFDNKIVVRQAIMKVAMKLMQILSPRSVLNLICENLSHKNSRVRQEALNIVIASLLTFPSYDFDLASLCVTVSQSLIDSKRPVRQAALECFAVLSQTMGSSRMSPLVHAVDQIELTHEGQDGIMAAVQARIARRQLPKMNSDGLVEYAVPVSSSATQRSPNMTSTVPADMEWILQGSGGGTSSRVSRQDTMELESVTSSARTTPVLDTNGPSPRRFLSAGRGKNRLPWEEEQASPQREYRDDAHPGSAPQGRVKENAPPIKPRTTWTEEADVSSLKKIKRRNTTGASEDGAQETSYRQIHLNKIQRQWNNQKSTGYSDGLRSYGRDHEHDRSHSHDNDNDILSSSIHSDQGGYSHSPVRRRVPHNLEDGYSDEHYFPSFSQREVKDELSHRMSLSNSWPDGKKLEDTPKRTNHRPVLEPISAPDTPITEWAETNNEDYSRNGKDLHVSESPIPLKATLARGSASRRTKLVPPILSDKGPSSPRDDTGSPNTLRDSGLGSTLEKTEEEMSGSLRQIRNSASRKKAAKIFSKMVEEDHRRSRSPSPFTDHRSNGYSDAHHAGRAVTDDTSHVNHTSHKTKSKQRHSKGPTLSPIERYDADDIGVVGRGMFDSSSTSESSKSTSRQNSKQDIVRDDVLYDVLTSRSLKTAEETHHDSDDDTVSIAMSESMRKKEKLKAQQRAEEAEQRRYEKEKEREKQRAVEQELRKQKEEERRKRAEDKARRRREAQELEKQKQYERLKRLASEEEKIMEDLAISGSTASPVRAPFGRPPPAATPPRRKSKSPTESPGGHRPDSLASSGSKLDNSMANEVLHACSHPENTLKNALADMEQDDWSAKCDGLLSIRRLAKHHHNVLLNQLHPVMLAVLGEVKNLRSQVSRVGILTIREMFENLGKYMDMELEGATKVLLQKNGESNAFFRDETEMALRAMIQGASPQRALISLINGGASHKNTQVRKTTAILLTELVDLLGPGRVLSGIKDMTDRILPAAAQFALDNSPETRYYGRKMLFSVMDHADFDKMLKKHLPAALFRNIQDILTTLKQKGLGDQPSETPSARLRQSGRSRSSSAGGAALAESSGYASSPSSSQSKTRNVRVPEQASEELKELANQMTSNEWKQRYEAIEKFRNISEATPDYIGGSIIKIFDKFNPRLQDSNSKVNLLALQTMCDIIPFLRDYLPQVLTMTIQSVAGNLSSKNKEIYQSAISILDTLVECIDPALLLQPYANQAMNGNIKIKPDMIEKVAYLVHQVYPKKPKQVVLHALPLLYSLIQGMTTSGSLRGQDVQEKTQSLAQVLHSLMGPALFETASSNLSPRSMKQLKEMCDATD